MANPNFPTDGQGDRIEALVDTAGAVYLKYGVGTKAVAGATNNAAWHGVATHVDGATAGGSDGVVLMAGEQGTTVRHLLVDASGVLFANEPQAYTILTSASRTTTQTGSDQTNPGAYRGLIMIVDVTTAGTGSITATIQGKDPVSGKYYTILASAAITTVTTNVYRVYPTITASANLIAQDVMPSIWRITVTANNANAITYSVGAVLVL